jgi:hypothetical protein
MNHKCKWTPLAKKSKVLICHKCGALWAKGGIKLGTKTITISPAGFPDQITTTAVGIDFNAKRLINIGAPAADGDAVRRPAGTADIADGAITSSKLEGSPAPVAGQFLRRNAANTAFEYATPPAGAGGIPILIMPGQFSLSPGEVVYTSPVTFAPTTVENSVAMPMPASTLKNFRVNINNGTNATVSISLRKNFVSVITITVAPFASGIFSELATSVSYAANDLLTYQISIGSGTGTADIKGGSIQIIG